MTLCARYSDEQTDNINYIEFSEKIGRISKIGIADQWLTHISFEGYNGNFRKQDIYEHVRNSLSYDISLSRITRQTLAQNFRHEKYVPFHFVGE